MPRLELRLKALRLKSDGVYKKFPAFRYTWKSSLLRWATATLQSTQKSGPFAACVQVLNLLIGELSCSRQGNSHNIIWFQKVKFLRYYSEPARCGGCRRQLGSTLHIALDVDLLGVHKTKFGYIVNHDCCWIMLVLGVAKPLQSRAELTVCL